MPIARWTLNRRLLAGAVLLLAVTLPIAGMLLSAAFRNAVESRADATLGDLARQLVGLVEADAGGGVVLSRPLGDPRFERVHGGWYWQLERDGAVLATSRSLWDERLPATPAQGPRGERLRSLALAVTVPGSSGRLVVRIAGPQAKVEAEVDRYERLLLLALGALGLLLLATLALQVRWGLAPLQSMRDALRAVRRGERQRLALALPGDLAELADAMDAVLVHQQALIERGRSGTGDLAHALKQPLASLRLALDDAALDPAAAREALARLSATVDHHLARASAAGRAQGFQRGTRLDEALAPVIEAIRRLHAGRGLVITADGLAGRQADIDAQDLQELIGNLLDNAARAARAQVAMRVLDDRGGGLLVEIEDDGPGLPAALRDTLPMRGLRLDESQPGSGLGLAIVTDLARLHGLTLSFGDSPLGGLRVAVTMPPSGRS